MKGLWRMAVCVCMQIFTQCRTDCVGSIRVIVQNMESHEAISNMSIALYDVTDLIGRQGKDDVYISSSDLFLMDLQEKYQLEKTDQNGELCFDHLDEGIYYLRQKGSVTAYAPMEPFILSIPLKTGDESVYNVISYPKMTSVEPSFRQEEWRSPVLTGAESPSLPVYFVCGIISILVSVILIFKMWR